jgi:transcriptional regulator with XRE-family HTH domain
MNILRLREVLKEKGMSGKDLAEKVEVTPASISNIVQGNSFPKPELLLKIAQTLDLDIRELFHPTKEDESPKEALQKVLNEIERIKDKL